MAKNEKRKWKSTKKNKNKKVKYTGNPKQTKIQVDLKAVLQGIYTNIIDLRTTCQGRCECCNVAMPGMSYAEFSQIVTEIWDKESNETKIDIICKCIEYFFHYEFKKFGMETMIKPCMLLDENGKCGYYESRPLNCRLYGLWPEQVYKSRVDKFEKAYEGLLERKDIPLNTQCPYVKRVDSSQELTEDIIEELFEALDNLDSKVGNFSKAQIKQGENRRTFHDWILLKIWGENGLSGLTTLMLGLDKEGIEDQIKAFKQVIKEKFTNGVPNITKEDWFMSEPVKKEILVKEARYYSGDDSIVFIGECDVGEVRHQIHSSSFTFGNKDIPTEMRKLAEIMVGKKMFIVFDPDLEGKIKDKVSLRYR